MLYLLRTFCYGIKTANERRSVLVRMYVDTYVRTAVLSAQNVTWNCNEELLCFKCHRVLRETVTRGTITHCHPVANHLSIRNKTMSIKTRVREPNCICLSASRLCLYCYTAYIIYPQLVYTVFLFYTVKLL